MKTTLNIIITTIITVSVIIAGEAKLAAKSTKLADHGINKTNINLTIESEEDIYGIQFDIRYNATQLSLAEDAILSKVPGVKIYSRIKEDGIARVLMFGMAGERLLDVTSDRISDLIAIQFKPEAKFRGTSVVELFDITLAGKAGIEIELSRSSTYAFEVSFLAPQSTSLSKNYPNPFNPSTTIDYELSESGMVSLIIYDLKGVVVRNLVNNYQEENYHNIVWDSLNDNGQAVASGRYILKMSTLGFSDTITMTLLK